MRVFWTWLAGAAAGFCCRVQLGVPLQGAATKCCCQSAAWALELACRCRVLIEGAAVRVLCALWS